MGCRGRTPLASEGNGYWYGFAPEAKEAQQYKFVLTAADSVLHRIDPYAAQVTNSVGNGVIYDHARFDWEGDDFTPPPLNELVIYELHAGTFAATQDGQVADLGDLADRLSHVVRLGVNALQIMPVAEFAGDYSWGYNPAHIFAVESSPRRAGRLEEPGQAAWLGLAVIQDVVYNHFGSTDLDLWQFDGWSESGLGASTYND